MKARHLYIIIIILYILAALSLLGMGSARHKLQQLQAVEQSQNGDSTAAPVAAEESTVAEETTPGLVKRSPEKQELYNKLTLWQMIAILFFAAASLLLVYKEKLIKKPVAKTE